MNWYAGGTCRYCHDPISELEPGVCRDCLDNTDRFWGDGIHIGPEPVDHISHPDTPAGNAEALLIYYINNVQVHGRDMYWHTDDINAEFDQMQHTIFARFGIALQ